MRGRHIWFNVSTVDASTFSYSLIWKADSGRSCRSKRGVEAEKVLGRIRYLKAWFWYEATGGDVLVERSELEHGNHEVDILFILQYNIGGECMYHRRE